MTTREDLIQGVRTWLQTTAAAAPLTDAQVYKADSGEGRPPIPYLSVRLLAYDITVGTDEGRASLDGGGIPVVSVRGQRRATVTVQAFGDLATEWLSEAKAALNRPGVILLLTSLGLAVNPSGSGQGNIAAVLADQTELRATHDFDLAYTYNSLEEQGVEFALLEFELTLQGSSTDLVLDLSIDC